MLIITQLSQSGWGCRQWHDKVVLAGRSSASDKSCQTAAGLAANATFAGLFGIYLG
jgi:hypothetical protein